MRVLFTAMALTVLTAASAIAQGQIGTGFDRDGNPIDGFSETPLDGLSSTDDGTTRADPGIASPPANFRELRLLDAPRARLRGLDTVNNTVDDFEINVGQTLIFKRLEVTLEACQYREGGAGTDAYAYLRIRDRREAAPRFEGWMLSSSPALSALDHPRYDVWVIACRI